MTLVIRSESQCLVDVNRALHCVLCVARGVVDPLWILSLYCDVVPYVGASLYMFVLVCSSCWFRCMNWSFWWQVIGWNFEKNLMYIAKTVAVCDALLRAAQSTGNMLLLWGVRTFCYFFAVRCLLSWMWWTSQGWWRELQRDRDWAMLSCRTSRHAMPSFICAVSVFDSL